MIAINFAVVKPHRIATGLAAFPPQSHVLNLSKTTGLRERIRWNMPWCSQLTSTLWQLLLFTCEKPFDRPAEFSADLHATLESRDWALPSPTPSIQISNGSIPRS